MSDFCGKRPVGWLGPGLTETLETPDLLAGAGIKYIGDWVYDDEPSTIRTNNGPLVTLPYTMELNDIPMMAVQHHEADYLFKRAIDQFDRLYAEGEKRAKIFCARDSSVSQRPAAPHQISRSDLRIRAQIRRRSVLDRRRDFGLVFEQPIIAIAKCLLRPWLATLAGDIAAQGSGSFIMALP